MILKKFVFKNVNSTNDIAIKIIKSSKNKSGIVIANNQKKGRGRYGKKWISYKGNLFVSFFYELKNINLSLPTLTKVNCLLVKKLLTKYYKKKIVYKKPNDLLVNKKKISGILQENISILGKKFLIVGIGINLVKNPKLINYPTTNLLELINKSVSKIKLENELKQLFEKNLTRLYKINFKINKI